jgi:CBS domain-containing protein
VEVGAVARWKVEDVMTEDVISVGADTTYKEIVEMLARHRVSALPVVGPGAHVLGVVSEADLLHKMELPRLAEHSHLWQRKDRREAREKATGDTAAVLMSTPAVTVTVGTPVGVAAHAMDRERVKRLPVVDGTGQLVGIVSRADLLRVYLRADVDIAVEIRDQVLVRTLWIDPAPITVSVDRGIVTLTGAIDRRSTVDIVGRLCEAVPGVVEVVNELSPEYDDTADLRRRHLMGPTVKETVP